jgi:hypothetical protein
VGTTGTEEILELVDGPVPVEVLFEQAVGALALLDAETLETMAEWLSWNGVGTVVLPLHPSAGRKRAETQRQVLGHLLESTARSLAMLRRVSALTEGMDNYGAGRGWP